MAIIETINGNRVIRKSDNNFLLQKVGTNEKYVEPDDYTNEWRVAHGLSALSYVETDEIIVTEEPIA